jgi:putative tryptophan/tyrosine transport system substrate-binding protein
MRRRDFIAGLGAAVLPNVGWAQKTAIPIVGFLSAGSPAGWDRALKAFREGLEGAGFVEGQNVEIDYRWAENRYDQLPSLVAELLRRQAAVIYAPGSTPAALAAKAATATVPIVFATGGDPVQSGLVASLSRPGTNATGVGFLTSQLVGKQFEIILELVPSASVVGGLVNPDTPVAEPDQPSLSSSSTSRPPRPSDWKSRSRYWLPPMR